MRQINMCQNANCNPTDVQRFLEGSLSESEQSAFEENLNQCDYCCSLLEESTADRSTWADVSKNLSASPELLTLTTKDCKKLRDVSLDFLGPTDDPHMMGRFAGYEIAGVIGIGGMGIVLKGFDRPLNRFVAIKVLLPHFASSAAARKRFAREARAAAAVVHDNVIAIHSVSTDISDPSTNEPEYVNSKELPFLVMPYLRGESLQKRLDRCGSLPLKEILRISIQVAEGLAAAHAQGLVHRDIKPSNILLPDDVERVTITDFGLARAADDASLTRTGVIAGTPQYMSPEQAEGRPVSSLTDLFSFGSLIYVMCTGRIPFRAESPVATLRRILDDEPMAIREINPEIPEWLSELVRRLHAKNPDDRPASAAEVAQILKDCLAHLQQPMAKPLPNFNKSTAVRTRVFQFLTQPAGWITMIATSVLLVCSLPFWVSPTPNSPTPPPTPIPKPSTNAVLAVNESSSEITSDGDLKKTFRVAFTDKQKPGKLLVDIKRGVIKVEGHDKDEIEVQLTVPKYNGFETESKDGLKTIRSRNLDFDIEGKGNRIKVDSNSNQFVTNLEIKVPRNSSLDLDTYRDGRILVTGVAGDIRARSQNSSIELSGTEGAIDTYTYNGSIKVNVKNVADSPYGLESYNGNIELWLPKTAKLNRKLEFRSGTGQFKTDIDFTVSEKINDKGSQGNVNIEFDKWRRGVIGSGGQSIRMETEKGDIVFRYTPAMKTRTSPPLKDNDQKDALSDLEKKVQQQKTMYLKITKFVADDKMPEFLQYAAKAGLLEAKRELAISQLKIEEAYSIEAKLILAYEKAIFSYKSMLDHREWQKRFPEMNINDVKPYQTKLDFYKNELAKRAKN